MASVGSARLQLSLTLTPISSLVRDDEEPEPTSLLLSPPPVIPKTRYLNLPSANLCLCICICICTPPPPLYVTLSFRFPSPLAPRCDPILLSSSCQIRLVPAHSVTFEIPQWASSYAPTSVLGSRLVDQQCISVFFLWWSLLAPPSGASSMGSLVMIRFSLCCRLP